jgi:hypothetical protein
MAPGPLLFPATSKERRHGKEQRQADLLNPTGSVEKMTPRLKKLGKRASKTIAVKG